ncbi:MAG: cyclic lactone autoinducer peptide [Eubacteriales bacterium]
MKNFIFKYGHILSAFALVVTTFASNRNCTYWLYDMELPESAKKLRKF